MPRTGDVTSEAPDDPGDVPVFAGRESAEEADAVAADIEFNSKIVRNCFGKQ